MEDWDGGELLGISSGGEGSFTGSLGVTNSPAKRLVSDQSTPFDTLVGGFA